jgi:hypothetical protein
MVIIINLSPRQNGGLKQGFLVKGKAGPLSHNTCGAAFCFYTVSANSFCNMKLLQNLLSLMEGEGGIS